MKEKNKKILKGFAVGALACFGMFTFTGCANINISQKKVDSLIERFEEFSGKITREEALNLCNNALLDSMFYENGYENVVCKTKNEGVDVQVSFYSNNQMTMSCIEEGTGLHVRYYDVETGNMVFSDFLLTRNGYVCTSKTTNSDFDASRYGDREDFAAMPLTNINPESLVSYQLLKNGNYSLLFAEEENETIELEEDEEGEYTITTYTTIEITKDAKIISLKERSEIELDFECDQQTWEDEFEYLVGTAEMAYTYGTVDVEFMQELYELAQAAPETPEEGE